ncbi:MAG: hypothetical protein V3U22_07180, partial [Vicinamibacteria bacterium]
IPWRSECYRRFRLRPHDIGHFVECPLSERPADLGQGSPLAVGQAQTTLDLLSKNTILGRQVIIPQKQFLINRSRDVRQHCLPADRVSSRELE